MKPAESVRHRQRLRETGNLTAVNGNIFLAIASRKREIKPVMGSPQRIAPKKPDYPAETPGSRLVAKARKLANKLTPEQRREHFNGAMAMIYGGAKEATLARH